MPKNDIAISSNVDQPKSLLNELKRVLNSLPGYDQAAHESVAPILDQLTASINNLPQPVTEPIDSKPLPVQSLIETIRDGFIILNWEWQFLYVNPRAAEIVGLKPEDLVNQCIWELYPQMLGTPQEAGYRRAMDQRESVQMLVQGVLTSTWYEINVYPIPQGIGVNWRDISSRKQIELEREQLFSELSNARESAEKAALESRTLARKAIETNAQTEAILNQLTDAVIVYDQNGLIYRANAFAVALFGFDPLQMNRNVMFRQLQIVGEDREPLPNSQFPSYRAEKGEIVLNFPLQITNPHRRSYSVMASAMPLYTGKTYAGVVLMFRDVTQRESLLAENRRQRVLLEQVILASPVGIALLEEPGHRYEMVNPYFMQYAKGNKDLLGQPAAEMWPELGDQINALLDEVLDTGQTLPVDEIQLQIDRGNGPESIYFSFSFTPLPTPDGQIGRILVVARDITESVLARQRLEAELEERRRVEAALQDSRLALAANEKRLRLATEAGEIGVWEYNLRTGELHWDARCRELFGLGHDEPIDLERFLSMIHPDDRAYIEGIIEPQSHLADGYEVNYRIIHPDASVHWLYERGRDEYDEQGQTTRKIGVILDITEMKEAEAERERLMDQIAAEHAWLEAVLDEMPVAILIADQNGRLLRKNALADEIWAGDAPLSQGIQDYHLYPTFWPETGRELLPEETPMARALKGDHLAGLELDILRLNGSKGTIFSSSAPVRDREGRVIGAVVVNQDITERKQVEQAIRESEAALAKSETNFRIALGNAPITVFTMDTDLRYTWIYNPYRGWPQDNLLGKRDEDLVPSDEVIDLTAFKQSVISSNTGMRGEFTFHFLGQLATFIITAEPLHDSAGNVVGLTGAALDVTEQRQLEKEQIENITQMEVQRRLLEHREMERQSIARDLHDGPLQFVISLLFSLQAAINLEPEGETGEILLNLRSGLQEMVGELRSVCNELRPPALGQFGLERAIRSHAADFQLRFPDLNLHLDLMEDGRRLPDAVRLALYRIYQEGLNNVSRHAKAKAVWVRLELNDQGIVMEITDNGRGIETPIDWVDLAREGHLGLVGMKERALAAGGDLFVKSQPKIGTTIQVVVPWQSSP